MTANTQDLPKQYSHAEPERKWYAYWLSKKYFHSEPDPEGKKYPKGPYTIVIPPPNVTGALHLGHALNNTLQDVLIRMKRMQGYNALWMPGTDHAGIATQAVVERRLLTEEKKSRHDLGREKLVERIWQWKNDYEKRILGQLQRLGASCDWERTRFTLDEMCARAVRQTFFSLFKEGLIYRGKRLVNWDTYLQTAVSDDEVENVTVEGHFWHFKYPVITPQKGEPEFVTIATTRPETMLGDTAVAVHPDPATALDKVEKELRAKLSEASEKQKAEVQAQLDALASRRTTMLPLLVKLRDMALAGRQLQLPLAARQIPLIVDEWAKPELGSGAVKITPAHDPNDYDVGKRQSLAMINIMNTDGTLNDSVPEKYRGLAMAKAARDIVVADMEAAGLLELVEDRQIEIPMSDRSKTPIEPYLADQWFVKMRDSDDGKPGLAQSAMDAVTDGRVKIFPSRYAKTYLDWLGEKRDWPVSRQLWWGHRIPVWTRKFARQAWPTAMQEAIPIGNSLDSESLLTLTDSFAFRLKSDLLTGLSESGVHVQVRFSDDLQSLTVHVCLRDSIPTDASVLTKALFVEDLDVLDTWFSSALWPHSTLGWPEQTPELAYYYPTSTLVTSRDIITLWVARMVLMGLHNMHEIPFHEVFIHPKILDGFGDTMSKSKGNGVDPIDVIDKFGADSLRFGLADLTTETQDVRMPVDFECPHCQKLVEQTRKNRILPRVPCKHCGKEFSTQWAEKPEDKALPRGAVVSERFEKGRNFCNKLWNAARFALMNLEGYTAGPVAEKELAIEDRWLLSRLATVTDEATTAFEKYQYSDACGALYEFAWDEFCSFYVEMVKSRLQDPQSRPAAQRVLAHTLDTLLRLLHPVIPFITEEIWQLLGEACPQRGLDKPTAAAESIMIAPWPTAEAKRQDREIEARFARFQELLKALREVRSRQNIPPKTTVRFSVRCDREMAKLLEPMLPYFETMGGATSVAWGPDVKPPSTSATANLPQCEVYVDLAGLIDVAAEVARKEKERDNYEKQIKAKEAKLSNASFVERAPAAVVEGERASLEEMRRQLAATVEALKALKTQSS